MDDARERNGAAPPSPLVTLIATMAATVGSPFAKGAKTMRLRFPLLIAAAVVVAVALVAAGCGGDGDKKGAAGEG
jgi:hypothetical protein